MLPTFAPSTAASCPTTAKLATITFLLCLVFPFFYWKNSHTIHMTWLFVQVSHSFWEVVANTEFKSSGVVGRLPLLRFALLKAAYHCPSAKVVNKECRFLFKSDVDSLAKKKNAESLAAEEVLRAIRTAAFDAQTPDDDRCKLMGRADCAVVRALLGKSQAGQPMTVKAAACAFHDELVELLGSQRAGQNPWESDRQAPPPGGPSHRSYVGNRSSKRTQQERHREQST